MSIESDLAYILAEQGQTIEEYKSRSRLFDIVEMRVYAWIALRDMGHKLQEIGNSCGRCHGTILVVIRNRINMFNSMNIKYDYKEVISKYSEKMKGASIFAVVKEIADDYEVSPLYIYLLHTRKKR